MLGNADPVHYAQMLPGVQTNNEYRSGINVEGCDNQHNTISIEGVPIYNVNHLLGFFSTFNTSHFTSMSIAKGLVSSGSPNRLGGLLDMLHAKEIPDSVSVSLSAGLVSSQATVRMPIGKNTSLNISMRGSYINLLYSQWLKADGQQIYYSFYDANVSLLHHLNTHQTLLFDFYSGNDNARFSEKNYLAEMKARWGNNMGAVHWLFNNGTAKGRTTAYITSYRNSFRLEMQDMAFHLPSGIADAGLKSHLDWKNWCAGLEAIWHNVKPQSLEHQGGFNISDGEYPSLHSLEASVYSSYKQSLFLNSICEFGLRGSLLVQNHSRYWNIDPSIRFLYEHPAYQLSATYALRHQYLFQTGFSESGLPTEFWMTASKDFKPQYAHEFSLSTSCFIFSRRYRISADLFYRRLYHQLSYRGSVLDYLNSVYDLNGSLMHGHGENYGFSVMLNKCSGPLTGWVSYTYTRTRRSFNETGRRKSFPAIHERPHELNAVATYSPGSHWNFGATLVCASGTPFTAAQSVYFLNNSVVVKYGDYNAARLPSYMRLDLAANYRWTDGRGREQSVNLSLYNATGQNNKLFYYLSVHRDGMFAYRPVSFILRVLPSLSYNFKF